MYRHVNDINGALAVVLVLSWICMTFSPGKGRLWFGAAVILCIIAMLAVKLLWYRCPHCGARLPFDRKATHGRHPYRCSCCGKHVEFQSKNW